ncbi:hypothetical protein Tco_1168369, partial [Tanacetum coccineum]
MVNGECQIQALVDKKKVIITEKSVKSDLMLEDAKEFECLPNDVIFEQLTLVGATTTVWNEFSSTMTSSIICLATNQKFNLSKYIFDNMMKNLEGGVKFLMYPRFVQVFLDKQVKGMSKHKGIYVTPSHTKKIFANMKRKGKGFSRKITPLFQTMMVQAPEDMGEDLADPIDSVPHPLLLNHHHLSLNRKSLEGNRRRTMVLQSLSLMRLLIRNLYLPLPVLDLEEAKTAQAKEKEEDVSKQGRKIADLDDDAKVTLIDETQERNDEDLMFDNDVLNGDEVFEEPIVNDATTTSSIPVSAADPVTTANATTTVDELTLAQTMIEIKAAKPKAVTTTATTITTNVASTRPKKKGIIFHDQEEQAPAFTPIVFSSQASQLSQAKDKGKAKMVEF